MAINKNALIRYKTIDRCLQNSNREWTLQNLIEACSDALYEYEGRDVNVSKRSIQMDIQLMRSDKLGYNAPIVVYAKKFYRYSDKHYSITNIPVTETDMHVLSEAVEMLKQFKDFSLFDGLNDVIHRLEDKVHSEQTKKPAIIHLEKNENLKGLQHLDVIYQAILKEIVLELEYQSFKARKPSIIVFYPFIIKEYNNRWFVVGQKPASQSIVTFALDRIISIDYRSDLYYTNNGFDADDYYRNSIGVTVMNDEQLLDVELKIDSYNAPYILTKPLHHSQQFLKRNSDGSIEISLKVHHNFELERLLMGFGEALKVLKPRKLRSRIKAKLKVAYHQYDQS